MEKRIDLLLKQLETEYRINLEKTAIIITSGNNRLYFSGMNSSEGMLIVTKNEAYFLVDFRYFEIACKVVKHLKVMLATDFFTSLKEILTRHEIKSVLIENEFTNLVKYEKIKSFLNGINVDLIDENILNPAIEDLRLIKTDIEIQKIKTAQEIAEVAFNQVIKEIEIGVTEKAIAAKLDYVMKKNGALSSAFDTIVLSGKNSSLPHGMPTDKKIEAGEFIVIDMGANFEGYCSDMTRTFAMKSVTLEQKKVYEIVLNAQKGALKTLKSGVKACDVDKVAREIIENTGYKGRFGHALGHGVGLDIHERPNLSSKSEQILKESMVVTVEPGIYIEDKFGVRIEDMVLIKKDGFDNFTKISKDLMVI